MMTKPAKKPDPIEPVPVPKKTGRPVKLLYCTVCRTDKMTSLFPGQAAAAVKNRCFACRPAKNEKEDTERRRAAKLRSSPAVVEFRRDFEERKRNRAAVDATTAFFKTLMVPRCECCYGRLATGQDPIGLRHWCSGCGWGIARTGRCLAHPGEVFYEGLPSEGIELPPELLAEMHPPPAPHYPEEAKDEVP